MKFSQYCTRFGAVEVFKELKKKMMDEKQSKYLGLTDRIY